MSLSKLKLDPSLNGDIISHMPPNIIENVLSRLNAMRNRNDDNVVKFIDDVLSLHRGPICKFKLSGNLFIRNDIQELVLCPQPLLRDHELPSCLYSCELLTHLQLSYCTLKRPPLFASFNFLKSLLLYKVQFVGFTYENLVSRCPILERLKIEGLTANTDFVFYAPKLKSLVGFYEITQNISLKNTPLLAYVSLNLHFNFMNIIRCTNFYLYSSGYSLRHFFSCLCFMWYFVVDFVPMKLPNTYYHMKTLELQICFNDVLIVSMALCFIRSAPNLEELKIDKMSIYGYKDPTITNGNPMNGAMMLEVLMRFLRMSPEAKIEYFENGILVELRK
ncbi:hypothetical protein NE237_021791 [Protea cynaroides]|uniref:F-box/LRR-repeat protein 15/At3g58940/PEG3-like LRR domain-containing protein n=1 Tax=Protea cynaroides TaxID=273540 RepID=A0A9Q0H8F3_9MAGN|nr:hypothetical protein NE237_021791 [Protea cynaroides]